MAAQTEAPQQGLSWDQWLTVQPPPGAFPLCCGPSFSSFQAQRAHEVSVVGGNSMIWAPEALEVRGGCGLILLGASPRFIRTPSLSLGSGIQETPVSKLRQACPEGPRP